MRYILFLLFFTYCSFPAKFKAGKAVQIEGETFDSNVKTLNLSQYDLKKIPKEILEFTNLEVLNLEENYIEKIENLDNLKNLKVLKLKGNFIQKLENLDSLTELEELDLWNNKIKRIHQMKLKILKISKAPCT